MQNYIVLSGRVQMTVSGVCIYKDACFLAWGAPNKCLWFALCTIHKLQME